MSKRTKRDMSTTRACRAVVLWIDWYAYHVARFKGLDSAASLRGKVVGLEFVGGVGVHAGLKFREELPANLPVHSLLPEGDWRRSSKWKLATKAWQKLTALDPELVLVPGYYTVPSLAAALWARAHRRTSVLMTESTAADHARSPWKEWGKSKLIRILFDWAVAGGTAHVRYLHQLGFPADRIGCFYDVVDNDRYRTATTALRQRKASDFGLPESYFLYVGRLAAEKNVAGLVTSWLEYRAQGGTWALVLAGDGPEAQALRAMLAGSAYVDDVYFVGLKITGELLPYYAFAMCFLLPSLREPWGLVVNEAMASGLPVIVSERCGCVEDLVRDGENGFIFRPEDPGALGLQMRRMAALEPEVRERMGARSLAIIEPYSPENFGREVERIANFVTQHARGFTPRTELGDIRDQEQPELQK